MGKKIENKLSRPAYKSQFQSVVGKYLLVRLEVDRGNEEEGKTIIRNCFGAFYLSFVVVREKI